MTANRPIAADFSELPNDPSDLHEILEKYEALLLNDEMPSIDEFADQFPEFTTTLQRILPMVQVMSDLSSDASDGSANSLVHLNYAAPKELGDFRILHEIGRGGMGVVYEADQISLDRRVALKVLPFAGLLEERQLRRFKNEARAAASLKHPNIVSVYGVGNERSIHFYTMELIDGDDVSAVIRKLHCDVRGVHSLKANSPVDAATHDTSPIANLSTQRFGQREDFFRKAARIGTQAADALHFAHQEGVIHRDIKPANLLLDKHGNIHVTDFGLARLPAQEDLTLTGDQIGTLRYMSPEQVMGRGVVDPRTDIYSLGLTLYELIGGRPAFSSSDRHQLMNDITLGEPRALRSIAPNVPRDFETIIHKAIACDPSDRYSSAEQLADDLRRFIANRPITARRTTSLERAARVVRRNPLVSTLSALMVLLLMMLAVAGAAMALSFSRQAHTARQNAERATTQSKLDRLRVYARDMRLANDAIKKARLVDAESMLLKWVPKDNEHDHRDIEWRYLWDRAHDGTIRHTLRMTLPQYSVAFSRDGSKLISSGWGKSISVWDWRQDRVEDPIVELDTADLEIRDLHVVAATGELLAGNNSGNVDSWEHLQAPKEKSTIELPGGGPIAALATSSDGRWVAVGLTNHDMTAEVFLCDRSLGERRQLAIALRGTPIVEFASDETLIVSSSECDSLFLVNTRTRETSESKLASADGVTSIAVSADGQMAAVASQQSQGSVDSSQLEFWDIASLSRIGGMSLNGRISKATAFSPESTMLAVGDENGILSLLDVSNASSAKVILERQAHSQNLSDIAFAPDGSTLATCGGDNNIHLWDIAQLAAPKMRSIPTDDQRPRITGACYVNRGKGIALADRLGQVRVFSLDSQTLSTPLPIDTRGYSHLTLAGASSSGLLAVQMSYWSHLGTTGRLVVWDLRRGQLRASVELPEDTDCSAPSISADGRQCAVCANGRVLIIDIVHQKVVRELEFAQTPRVVVFSPGGKWLGVGCRGGRTRVYSTRDFTLRHELKTDESLAYRVAFSPDDQMLATSGFSRRLKLFDIETERLLRESEQIPGLITSIGFSPNGKRVLTCGIDGDARIWMTESAEQLLDIAIEPNSWPTGMFSFAGDGFVVASGGEANFYTGETSDSIFRLSVSQLQEVACGRPIPEPRSRAASD